MLADIEYKKRLLFSAKQKENCSSSPPEQSFFPLHTFFKATQLPSKHSIESAPQLSSVENKNQNCTQLF